jgi:hypothetical protein
MCPSAIITKKSSQVLQKWQNIFEKMILLPK